MVLIQNLTLSTLTTLASGDEERFRQGETLEVVGGVNSPLLVVGTDGVSATSITVTDPDTGVESFLDVSVGYASAVKVEEGIYFVNGYFREIPSNCSLLTNTTINLLLRLVSKFRKSGNPRARFISI